MERCRGANPARCSVGRADGERPAHAVSRRADPALHVDRSLLVEPANRGARITPYRSGGEQRDHRPQLGLPLRRPPFGNGLEMRGGSRTVILVEHKHRITIGRQAPRHHLVGIAQAGNVWPQDHAGVLALGGMHKEGIHLAIRRGEGDHPFRQTLRNGPSQRCSQGTQPRRAQRSKTAAIDPLEFQRAFFFDCGQIVTHRQAPFARYLVITRVAQEG